MLAFSALLFLIDVNFVLQRLGAMLPDETLRLETRQYTRVNHTLLIALLTLIVTYLVVSRILLSYFSRNLPPGDPAQPHGMAPDILSIHIPIPALGVELTGFWLVGVIVCLLVLLPLAMTMALIWKTKEVILDSVFGAKA